MQALNEMYNHVEALRDIRDSIDPEVDAYNYNRLTDILDRARSDYMQLERETNDS